MIQNTKEWGKEKIDWHQSTKPTVYLQPYNPAIENVSLILGHTKFPIPAAANLFKSPPPMYNLFDTR